MEYLGLLVFFFIMLGLALVLISLNYLLGPKTPDPMEDYPYECGVPLYDKSAQNTFHQGYYLLGLMLLLFDIEAAFLFPWAVVYKNLGFLGFTEMVIFILILTYGLLYAWRTGALDWQFEEERID
ncbi:NADH-quinone oxidoreductase subunit A [Thermocrinis minervae]|uniref:NADH-quinone oxidoreductase subunit A n=1 Tax=Thermocrinis minervae TaxID=381751 RepID=A0A1M6TMX2_9AQUI|nr:NADH-quinone oxidoreductase subunit A [Thermocrinis minervae]SHK58402.1 NADH dehydrogenase subunit A [Thermocrinis minervae]